MQETVECNSCCVQTEDSPAENPEETEAALNQDEIKLDSGLSVRDFKIILLFSMIVTMGFGLLPRVCGVCKGGDVILSLLNCFSGGIFLGMSLIHIMPEAAEEYGEWAEENGIEKPFPLPFVMIFLGYLLILAVDRVLAGKFHKHDHGDHDHGHGHAKHDHADKDKTNKDSDEHDHAHHEKTHKDRT